jgi:hypothetical protein
MTTCAIMNHTLTNNTLTDNNYLNTLIKENEQLKNSNNKLYKRTLNLKRKNLRLKKMLNSNDSSEQTDSNNDQVITDVIWEDVNDLIQSYEIEDQINNVAEKLVNKVLNDSNSKKKTE